MKKLCSFILIFGLFFANILANPATNTKEYVLENGLTAFLLEDSSTPIINVEFIVRAGFADQTPQTTGFFKLYTMLFREANPQINFSLIDCNSDSTKYCFTVTNSQLENTLSLFADSIFNSNFSDDILNEQLANLKNQVTEDSSSMAMLINSAIDSKVFSDSPWRHDSGIYPAIFKKTTEKTARTYITDIQNNWYIPQNCAIFISGNINSERCYTLLRNTFGKYTSNVKISEPKKLQPRNTQKKFVIHNEELSDELTQLVVQYTLMDLEQTDILAQALNNKYSTFKQQVLSLPELNIPGDEYINVAQAHEQATTRLIFQTLIQEPEDKKIKTSSVKQAEKFVQQIKTIPETLQPMEFTNAKNSLSYNLDAICQTSQLFMENLADFWTALSYNFYKPEPQIEEAIPESLTAAKMLSRVNQMYSINYNETLESLKNEEPYVFVIINTADYKKNKKAYDAAGYEEINSKNNNWYVQTMYKNIRDQFKPDENQYYSNSKASDNDYFKKNLLQLKTSTLSNGINITTKINQNTSGLSLLINIKGGKLNSPDDNGFEEVMVNMLSNMIQKELFYLQNQQIILGAVNVSTSTDLYTSQILIEASSFDFEAICAAVAQTLIYGEAAPATADRSVSGRQYKKRLENGSAVSQMYAAAINKIYPGSSLSKIYETENDILLDTTYTKILAAYPDLLNASRYDFIVSGNFTSHEQVVQTINKNFSQLDAKGFNIKGESKFENIGDSPLKDIYVKINHTFLTDIPAEKAGPMPAVLIPTTEFLDPVIYLQKVPAEKQQQALYYATINYLEVLINKEIQNNKRLKGTTVQVQLPKAGIPFVQITFMNVKHTKEVDVCYQNAIQKLSDSITKADKYLAEEITNQWIVSNLSAASTNSGTAKLIQQGYEYFSLSPQPDFYLQQYNYIQKAGVTDYQQILHLIQEKPFLKIYSADSNR